MLDFLGSKRTLGNFPNRKKQPACNSKEGMNTNLLHDDISNNIEGQNPPSPNALMFLELCRLAPQFQRA
jgi:hypothetical protein